MKEIQSCACNLIQNYPLIIFSSPDTVFVLNATIRTRLSWAHGHRQWLRPGAEQKRMVLSLLRAGCSAAQSSAGSFSSQLPLFLTHSSIKQADNVAGNHGCPKSIAVAYQMWTNSQRVPWPPLSGEGVWLLSVGAVQRRGRGASWPVKGTVLASAELWPEVALSGWDR